MDLLIFILFFVVSFVIVLAYLEQWRGYFWIKRSSALHSFNSLFKRKHHRLFRRLEHFSGVNLLHFFLLYFHGVQIPQQKYGDNVAVLLLKIYAFDSEQLFFQQRFSSSRHNFRVHPRQSLRFLRSVLQIHLRVFRWNFMWDCACAFNYHVFINKQSKLQVLWGRI